MLIAPLLLASCALAAPASSPSFDWPALKRGWRENVLRIAESGRLPMIDLLSSFNEMSLDPEVLARRMEEQAVAVALLAVAPEQDRWMGRAYADWPRAALGLVKSDASRFMPVPSAGLDRALLRGDDPDRFLGTLFQRILGDGYPLMGEFRFRVHASNAEWINPPEARREGEVDIPLEGPLARQIFEFSQRHRLPFLLRYEIEDALLPPLERMLDEYPGARVVWRSVGRVRRPPSRLYGPAYVRRLLDAHPNLFLDLSWTDIDDYDIAAGTTTSVLWDRRFGSLDPAWARLIIERPWRFMAALGLDQDDTADFTRQTEAQRRLLLELPPTTRAVVAYRAAWKLLFGEELPDPTRAPSPRAAAPPSFDWAKLKRGWRARILDTAKSGRLPLFDVESCYKDLTLNAAAFARAMDRGGAALIAFSPELDAGDQAAGGWSASVRRLVASEPSRFVPVPTANLQSVRDRGLDPYVFLDGLFADALQDGYPMLGEFSLAEYPSNWLLASRGRQAGPELRGIQPDGPVAEKIFAFSQEHGIPFQVHLEIEDGLLSRFEAMLAKYPKAKVIWCHTGRVRYSARTKRYGASYIRALIERHPNLYLDLSAAGPHQYYPPVDRFCSTFWDPKTGRFSADWARLIADHPWRFLTAFDMGSNRMTHLDGSINASRALLENIPTAAREIVAYKAAWKLLFREPF